MKKSNGHIFRSLICVAILFAVAFSAFYIVARAGHDCAGEHCVVCHQMELCKKWLRALVLAAAVVGATAVSKPSCRYEYEKHHGEMQGPTLVALRVKLSN